MNMKRSDVLLLTNLKKDIELGCTLLGTDQANFISALNRFNNIIELGVEIGLNMKAKVAAVKTKTATVEAKAAPKKALQAKPPVKKTEPKKGKTEEPVITRMVRVMGDKVMSAIQIEKALQDQQLTLNSKDPKAYISMILSTNKGTFIKVRRGEYRVSAKKKILTQDTIVKASKEVTAPTEVVQASPMAALPSLKVSKQLTKKTQKAKKPTIVAATPAWPAN